MLIGSSMMPRPCSHWLTQPALLSSRIQAYVRMRKFVQNGSTTATSATVRHFGESPAIAYAIG